MLGRKIVYSIDDENIERWHDAEHMYGTPEAKTELSEQIVADLCNISTGEVKGTRFDITDLRTEHARRHMCFYETLYVPVTPGDKFYRPAELHTGYVFTNNAEVTHD